ncbi:DDE-type integrase/transposase/recombinase [Patescibacteria group bacterium]|nr:DDE-type integrase/transposase/recombinase [Patescibacteria group bacterium]
MIKLKLIKGIINLSSLLQTYLINYLEFYQIEPRELKEKGYDILGHPPEKPENVPKPFQKDDVVKPHYKILLKLAEEQGKPIKSLNRRYEPLRTGEKECRKCKAPREYLRNHGYYTRRTTGERFPKHTCKVCLAEYAPGAERKKPKHICPYCGYAMNPKNYYKNFVGYYCKTEDCPHKKLHEKGHAYSEREWNFDYDKLEATSIESHRNLEKLRISKQMLDMEMSLYVECGVTARETKKILQKLYGEVAVKSHQSILNHAEALAGFLKENESFLPVIVGDEVCEDETYIKYFGRWGYLFRALNPDNRAIISEHFSKHRDTKGCITLNKGATGAYLSQCRDPEFRLISDQAPIYGATKSYFDEKNLAKIDLKTVKGIFNEPDEENGEYRSQKQTIERSFESLKSAIKRRRGFSSFKGAEIFCFLHKIYYNHLRCHTELGNAPPIPLHMKSGRRVTNWHELLQYLAEKRR